MFQKKMQEEEYGHGTIPIPASKEYYAHITNLNKSKIFCLQEPHASSHSIHMLQFPSPSKYHVWVALNNTKH